MSRAKTPKWERPEVRQTLTLPSFPHLEGEDDCTGEEIVIQEGSDG